MKDLLVDFIAIMELVGMIALVGICGGIDQDTMTVADGIKNAIIITVLMLIGAGILWLTRDREKFE
jgi:3-keto-L-gulonate-6-phosphate decarboxylase